MSTEATRCISVCPQIYLNLPQKAKYRLEGFLDEDYPLDKFVDRVEHQRQWLEATHTPTLGRVKPEMRNYPLKPDTQPETHNASPNDLYQSNATSRESSEVNEIKTQIKDLTEQLGKLQTSPRQSQKDRYCSHCHSHSHNLKECWRKPSRGSCSDCQQYGCWRRNKYCLGKPKTTYLAQAHTSPTISLVFNNKIMRAVVDTGSCYTLIKGSNSK